MSTAALKKRQGTLLEIVKFIYLFNYSFKWKRRRISSNNVAKQNTSTCKDCVLCNWMLQFVANSENSRHILCSILSNYTCNSAAFKGKQFTAKTVLMALKDVNLGLMERNLKKNHYISHTTSNVQWSVFGCYCGRQHVLVISTHFNQALH